MLRIVSFQSSRQMIAVTASASKHGIPTSLSPPFGNVLEKLHTGEALNAKDRETHDKGLISVLKQLHDNLDATVIEAYGWTDLRRHDTPVVHKEAPHSCGAGECEALDKREALPKDLPIPSRQERRDSLPPADLLARGGPAAEALEQQLLTRLVALNHERAAEEKRGLIRWLRPHCRAPASSDGHRTTLHASALTGPWPWSCRDRRGA